MTLICRGCGLPIVEVPGFDAEVNDVQYQHEDDGTVICLNYYVTHPDDADTFHHPVETVDAR